MKYNVSGCFTMVSRILFLLHRVRDHWVLSANLDSDYPKPTPYFILRWSESSEVQGESKKNNKKKKTLQ